MGCLPNCVTAVFAFPGGLFSLIDDSRTGYPPRALFCADGTARWWCTPNPIMTGATPFVNCTVAHVPTDDEFDVDIQQIHLHGCRLGRRVSLRCSLLHPAYEQEHELQ